ncbi:MAG: type I-E CRISPR-associated protein Cas5/CasD [Rhodocyclaceae bacterium]|nr:type I-E CRISPR-associated protein Cas5/CasD [Rhodocyclaceae bacterium]MCA3116134.1 type I-E CRISPR-associated protein Cas5/CasD [Rhodocyclaceae bacterium]MCA3847827.1 type I-E CRISPR-associated protein Cas5/CasD [Burkholderia sp.]
MTRHLVLRLAAPLIAFGGEAIDNRGVIRDFPALSMLTGLIANALGWDRANHELHNRLQERLRMGTALEPGSRRLQDFQTAELGASDSGWTTWGQPEERRGGAGSYASPHLRYRDYQADFRGWVVLALQPADEAPTLSAIADALDRPVRPLFIGRKACVPSERLVAGWQDSDNVLGALRALVNEHVSPGAEGWRVQWPEGEGAMEPNRRMDICDERNWTSGLHGGWRPVYEAIVGAQEIAP